MNESERNFVQIDELISSDNERYEEDILPSPIAPRSVPTYEISDENWRNFGGCIDEDPNLFSEEKDKEGVKAAKIICQACQVNDYCLAFGLDNLNVRGILGGATTAERSSMRRKGVRISRAGIVARD